MTLYEGIFAKLYDTLFEPSSEELSFYRSFFDVVPGTSLELACGTGQFLVHFLKGGYDVEGVDASKEMLLLCREKAQKSGFKPVLYEQYMQTLAIKKQYATIYIPSASFMLISEYDQAVEALKRFYEHLLPGGQVLISLFVPWHERTKDGVLQVRAEGIPLEPGLSITWYESLKHDPVHQLRKALYRFEHYKHNELVKVEQAAATWRWYGIYELAVLLEQAGFKEIKIYGDYTLERPTKESSVICFRAIKT